MFSEPPMEDTGNLNLNTNIVDCDLVGASGGRVILIAMKILIVEVVSLRGGRETWISSG